MGSIVLSSISLLITTVWRIPNPDPVVLCPFSRFEISNPHNGLMNIRNGEWGEWNISLRTICSGFSDHLLDVYFCPVFVGRGCFVRVGRGSGWSIFSSYFSNRSNPLANWINTKRSELAWEGPAILNLSHIINFVWTCFNSNRINFVFVVTFLVSLYINFLFLPNLTLVCLILC